MLEFILATPIIGAVAAALVVAVIIWLYAKKLYKNPAPNEALIITGKRGKKTIVDGAAHEESGMRIVKGQGAFVTPYFQKAHTIGLHNRSIDINAIAQDTDGVTIRVDAVAIVKVGSDSAAIRAAAERFLGQEKNIDAFSQEVLSGSLRASIGTMNVSTIIRNRDSLSESVLNTARDSLSNQGIGVDSFEIKGIDDENGYIDDLGRAQRAEVRKQAEIAEHLAKQKSREQQVLSETAIAEAENSLALRQAALQLDTDRAAAEAAAARPLAEAKAQQDVVAEQERTARERVRLREAELESSVRAEADAAAYRLKVEAEAEKDATVARAEADQLARIAAAEALRQEGIAEAEVIRQRGDAEAEATEKSAKALSEQSDALIRLRVIEALPKIAHELAAPMGNIDQLTVVSTDGASQLTKNVASGLTEVDSVLGSTLGVGFKDLLGSFVGGTAAGTAAAKAAAAPVAERGVLEVSLTDLEDGLPDVASGTVKKSNRVTKSE